MPRNLPHATATRIIHAYARGMPTDPHPITGTHFPSPVPPGTGWPDDPATAATPVATTQQEVATLAAASPDLHELNARMSVCRACPRLIEWRESIATTGRRASFADQPYWGRPVPSFGDARTDALVVGLAPAANGGNRTGRVFTGDRSGDWLYAALHRAGYGNQPTSTHAGDGLALTGLRILAAVRCAPPDNKPTTAERDTCSHWMDAELALLAPNLKVILALGDFGWDATLRSARRLGWDVPAPNPASATATRATRPPDGREITCWAASTSASATPSPASSPRRCWTPCWPGCRRSPGNPRIPPNHQTGPLHYLGMRPTLVADNDSPRFSAHLHSHGTSLVIATPPPTAERPSPIPVVVHFGAELPASIDPDALIHSLLPSRTHSGPDFRASARSPSEMDGTRLRPPCAVATPTAPPGHPASR